MSYRQYTQCIDISLYNPQNPYAQAALLGLYISLAPGAFVGFLILLGAASPWCLLIVAEIYLIAAIVGYCYWWLYRRLICLPAPPDHPVDKDGSQMLIGTLIDILPPSSAQFPDLDNDYSVGILVQCNPLGARRPQVEMSQPYGYLLVNQPVTLNANLPFPEKTGVDHEFPGHPELEIQSEILHCEFEGRGVYDMFLASLAALFVAELALFACMVPDIGWIVALILSLLAILGLATGWAVGQFDGGNPNDEGPNVGELHRNDENHQGADTLLIKGHWVYDSGHRYDHTPPDGYNELHPITFCTKTSSECGGVIFLERWKVAIDDATSTATIENQKLPQNQWQIHPLIDGCQPVIIV
jgi:hypothetical protein